MKPKITCYLGMASLQLIARTWKLGVLGWNGGNIPPWLQKCVSSSRTPVESSNTNTDINHNNPRMKWHTCIKCTYQFHGIKLSKIGLHSTHFFIDNHFLVRWHGSKHSRNGAWQTIVHVLPRCQALPRKVTDWNMIYVQLPTTYQLVSANQGLISCDLVVNFVVPSFPDFKITRNATLGARANMPEVFFFPT